MQSALHSNYKSSTFFFSGGRGGDGASELNFGEFL